MPKAAVASEIRYVLKPKFPLILTVVETQWGVVNPVMTTVVKSFDVKYASKSVPIKLLFTFFVMTISSDVGATNSFIAKPSFFYCIHFSAIGV